MTGGVANSFQQFSTQFELSGTASCGEELLGRADPKDPEAAQK
jgi:hypothetical protein